MSANSAAMGRRPPLAVLACAAACWACGACGATHHGADRQRAAARRAPASIPRHVETWAYVDSCHGVGRAEIGLVRRWVTFAESKCASDRWLAPAACATRGRRYCTSIAYLDPNLDWSEADLGLVVPSCTHPVPQASACGNEDWFVHLPGSTGQDSRLRWTSPDLGFAYLLDDAASGVQRFIAAYARRALADFDALMVDDVGASIREQFYGDADPIYTASDELRSDADVLREHATLAARLAPFVQVDNGLSVNPFNLPAFPLLGRPRQVVGLVAEGYPESAMPNRLAEWYSTGLDDIAYLEHAPALRRDFIALLGYNARGSLAARRVQEATLMLGFEPGRLVDWEDLDTDRPGLAVWPEEGLYFTEPLQTMGMPSGPRCLDGLGGPCARGHADLQVAGGHNAEEQPGGAGVYRREFRACYLRGAPIGPCAAVVNDTEAPVVVRRSWLVQRYRHEIELDRGDVQAGGEVDVHGPEVIPGSTTIGPDDALLLSR
jgi:hypothetical protein